MRQNETTQEKKRGGESGGDQLKLNTEAQWLRGKNKDTDATDEEEIQLVGTLDPDHVHSVKAARREPRRRRRETDHYGSVGEHANREDDVTTPPS